MKYYQTTTEFNCGYEVNSDRRKRFNKNGLNSIR
jgi:hypothetical protein